MIIPGVIRLYFWLKQVFEIKVTFERNDQRFLYEFKSSSNQINWKYKSKYTPNFIFHLLPYVYIRLSKPFIFHATSGAYSMENIHDYLVN